MLLAGLCAYERRAEAMKTNDTTKPAPAAGSALLPCPFCGGPSKLLVFSGLWSAGCTACGIETLGLLSEVEATDRWNQRKEWDHVRIGSEMREARKAAGVSVRALSSRLQCSPAYVSDLELGRRCWTPEKLRRYRDALTSNTERSGGEEKR